jgi:hypothetical protein
MEPNTLSSALNTIAQCAAALAALIGFFGLWRLDRLREVQRQVRQDLDQLRRRQLNESISSNLQEVDRRRRRELEESIRGMLPNLDRSARPRPSLQEQPSPRPSAQQGPTLQKQIETTRTRLATVQSERRQLMDVLVTFLLGTLAVLVLAIGLIPFAEALSTRVWTMRVFITVLSLWLGVAPAYVVLQAAGRGRDMEHLWSRLWYHIRRPWRRIRRTWRRRAPIVEQLRGQWLRLRRGEGAPIRERGQWLARVIEHAGTRLRTWHGPTQIAGWLKSQWRRERRKDP